jgi:hypothetical protein
MHQTILSSILTGTLALSVAFTSLLSPANASDGDVDLVQVAEAISRTFENYHYDPEELQSAEFLRLDARMHQLAAASGSTEAFVAGFTELWSDGPFSHVRLSQSSQTAEEMAAYLDSLAIGGGGAVLSWKGDIAILTVNTMMGTDTIEEIEAAYQVIFDRGASGLIIDLRENGGGAFAVKPLVEHVLDAPLDAGAFVSRAWNAEMDRAPTLSDLEGVAPWTGWSIRQFWQDAQNNRLTRIRFTPAEHVIAAPVYVLVSARTASAAELAADALLASGRTVLIGERTAGQMLSQKMYDLPGGLQLSLPIADYYSLATGRIEGHGVQPTVEVAAADAMNHALDAAARGDIRGPDASLSGKSSH